VDKSGRLAIAVRGANYELDDVMLSAKFQLRQSTGFLFGIRLNNEVDFYIVS
jgi:hypothetical protein